MNLSNSNQVINKNNKNKSLNLFLKNNQLLSNTNETQNFSN
jgi:hypothetical protein